MTAVLTELILDLCIRRLTMSAITRCSPAKVLSQQTDPLTRIADDEKAEDLELV